MALIDPCGDRQKLDGGDSEPGQMSYGGRMCEAREGSANGLRDVRDACGVKPRTCIS